LDDKGISFHLTPKAKEFLADKGYDPAYGARPLKRALQRHLEDPLAEEILRGQYAGDCDLFVDSGNDKLTFTFNRSGQEEEEKVS
jgi:ATP-dependent Clp protease ATP-binding subunit ClpB